MKEKYPLDQLQLIKQKRLEAAEKNFMEKKALLVKEEQKLQTLEKARDEVNDHYKAKLLQLREKLDSGASTDKITQIKYYLKEVVENLKREEIKVANQKTVVKNANNMVALAREAFIKMEKDVEKLKIHHKKWYQEQVDIEEKYEELNNDEIGNNRFVLKHLNKEK
jgi:DNA-binding phage protein